MAVRIERVEKNSPAEKAGLRGGVSLLSINGREIRDGLDYAFFSSAARLDIVAEGQGGAPLSFTVHKEEYAPLGCVFQSYLIDAQHHCKNRCLFCFIDQLPAGLRSSLYFKDDDERLGFLFGNYITLTNLSDEAVRRIMEMRFSPVNISVHTMNEALRATMMGNPGAGQALSVIPRLADAGIEMNFQLVLCPHLNDGTELETSIEKLAAYYPATQSIAAVPVGLTRHREGLAPLRAYTAQEAEEQLDLLLAAGERYLKKYGTRLVYPSDEWFLLAGRPLPGDAFYESYPQLENGVGMWRLFETEFTAALRHAAKAAKKKTTKKTPPAADLATGTLAAPLMRGLAAQMAEAIPGAALHVHAVKNDFLGHGVTVSGLLTGQDIISQLKGKLKTGTLLLPKNLLRAEGDLLLDSSTPDEIAHALDVAVKIVPTAGDALIDALLDA